MRRTYHGGNTPPSRKSLAVSKEFWRSHPGLPNTDLMVEIAEDRVTKGRNPPGLSNFVDMSRILTEEFGAAWSDGQSVRDASLKATERLTQLLKEGEVGR
jgi:hypothetical protein